MKKMSLFAVVKSYRQHLMLVVGVVWLTAALQVPEQYWCVKSSQYCESLPSYELWDMNLSRLLPTASICTGNGLWRALRRWRHVFKDPHIHTPFHSYKIQHTFGISTETSMNQRDFHVHEKINKIKYNMLDTFYFNQIILHNNNLPRPINITYAWLRQRQFSA